MIKRYTNLQLLKSTVTLTVFTATGVWSSPSSFLEWPKQWKLLQGPLFWRGDITGKKKCNSKSNSFVAEAEQVCLQPVLEQWQWRGWCNIVWQAIPHLCSSNRKGTTSDSWLTTGQNIKLFSGGGPEPASVRHVGDTWMTTPSKVVRNHAMPDTSASPPWM